VWRNTIIRNGCSMTSPAVRYVTNACWKLKLDISPHGQSDELHALYAARKFTASHENIGRLPALSCQSALWRTSGRWRRYFVSHSTGIRSSASTCARRKFLSWTLVHFHKKTLVNFHRSWKVTALSTTAIKHNIYSLKSKSKHIETTCSGQWESAEIFPGGQRRNFALSFSGYWRCIASGRSQKRFTLSNPVVCAGWTSILNRLSEMFYTLRLSGMLFHFINCLISIFRAHSTNKS